MQEPGESPADAVRTLAGLGLTLTPITGADSERVYQAGRDPLTARWLPWAKSGYTRRDAEEFTTSFCPEQWRAGNPVWGIRIGQPGDTAGEAGGGPLVGAVALEQREPGTYEVGFWGHPEARGQGITTRAAALAVNAAFADLGARRVVHVAEVGNYPSQRIARNLGFHPEGTRRDLEADGSVLHSWQSGLLATDWPGLPEDALNLQTAPTAPVLPGSAPQELVSEFHRVYQMPNLVEDGADPSLDTERLGMRMSLIAEELVELYTAVYGPKAGTHIGQAIGTITDQGERDLVETADALADLTYVIYGMALEVGIDLDRVMAEVHSSNLSKLMEDGSVKRREDGKVLKGPNFREPDIAGVLGQARD